MFPFFDLYFFPPGNNIPPTIYAILNSLLNYDNENKTSIENLAKEGHSLIFDFDYPLSEKVNKDEFETLILNKFLMRRIGYETVTAFKIALSVKLQEIMPTYNKMFDFLIGWDLFKDGEIESRVVTDTNSNKSESNTNNNTDTKINSINKNKFSELPQGQLSDIDNNEYLSTYTVDEGNSNSTSDNTITTKLNADDERKIEEVKYRTPSSKIEIYKNFVENKESIYSMIFKDLSILFFGVE